MDQLYYSGLKINQLNQSSNFRFSLNVGNESIRFVPYFVSIYQNYLRVNHRIRGRSICMEQGKG